jgi:hypothetical protein
MLDHALKLHSQGFNVVFTKNPAKIGGKAPIGLWTKWIEQWQTAADIKKMHQYALTKENDLGLAVICREGLECLDIDVKYFLENKHFVSDVFDGIMNAIGLETFDKLVLAETISNGYHLLYRTNKKEGSQKLASRPTLDSEKKNEHDKVRVLLETRSHGGIFVVSPSIGYAYDNPNKTVNEIPLISDSDRETILNVCRGFNEIDDVIRKAKTQPIDTQVLGEHKSTIQDFKEKNSCRSIIETKGWQYSHARGDNEYFVRPGKSIREGISASIYTKDGKDVFWNWSNSIDLPAKVAMDSISLYAFYNTNDDVKAACKELYAQGYGDRLSKRKDSHNEQVRQATTIKEKPADLKKDFQDCRILTTVKYVQKPSTLFIQDDKKQKRIGLGGYGDIVNIYGARKSKKTGIAMSAASCFLKGGCGTSLKFSGSDDGKNVVHFDTEQSKYYAQRVGKEMKHQAGLNPNQEPPNFFSFSIRQKSKIDRLNFIKHVLYNEVNNIGIILLDGIVDVCRNYNDLEESSDLVTFFENASMSKQFLMLDIIHTARSTGDARGHLGGELLNKGTANLKVTAEKNSPFSTFEIDDKRGEWTDVTFDFYYDSEGHIDFY